MNEKRIMPELRELPQDREVSKTTKQQFYKALREEKGKKPAVSGQHRNLLGRISVGLAGAMVIAIALLIILPNGVNLTGDPSGESGEGVEQELEPGSGGDLEWWKNAREDVGSANEKTLAGFAISVMKREIGTGKVKTSIDQYFGPDVKDYEKKLAAVGYRASSPSASKVYVTRIKEDSAGVTYHLKTILTTSVPTDRFEGTITFHIDSGSHKIDQLTVGQIQNVSREQQTNQDPLLDTVQMVSRTTGWAIDFGRLRATRILRTTDGGHTWQPVLSKRNNMRIMAKFLDENTAWVIGSKGRQVFLYRTNDGGETWKKPVIAAELDHQNMLNPVSLDVDGKQAWLVVSPNHGMNSSPGILLHSTDGGDHWKRIASVHQKENLPFVGTIEFRNARNGWISGVTASTRSNELYRTTDGGKTWMHVGLPWPEKITAEGKLGVALPKFFTNQPQKGVLYAAFLPKSGKVEDFQTVLYTTDDGGSSWHFNKAFPEFHVFAPIDASHWLIWDSKSYDSNYRGPIQGQFYRTEDAGDHWKTIQPGSDLKQVLQKGMDIIELDFVNPKVGWALVASRGHQHTGLLKTEDGGRTWRSVNISSLSAKFAWQGRVYNIWGNRTPSDKIGEEIGSIQRIVGKIDKNGDGKTLNDTLNLTAGAKIYSIQDVSKETVVAVKINNIYYTAIFAHRLD